MYFTKRAMPVHHEVEDFDSHHLVNEIPDLILMLKEIKTPNEYLNYEFHINHVLRKLWFEINFKKGINLRDREKLEPVFLELNRIFNGAKTAPVAFRGVRASNFDPNILSETYSLELGDEIKNPKEKRILQHLEGLAYGLRSWTLQFSDSVEWANLAGTTKDKIIFQIENPDIVLEADPFLRDGCERTMHPLDWDEVILFVKNPKIVSIEKIENEIFLIKIKDN